MKRKAIFVGAFLLIVLLGSLFFWLFTKSTSPTALQEELSRMLGARVEIKAAERLWLPPGVVLHQFEFEAPAYSLQGRRAEVRLALLPLLRGRGAPSSVQVSDARLELRSEQVNVPPLPLQAAWDIRRLEVWAPVGGRPTQIFHLERAVLAAAATKRRRLEMVGGASAAGADSLRVRAEAETWQLPSLPEGSFRLELEGLPAQPLLAYLVDDHRLLRRATLQGEVQLESRTETATAQGTLQATSPTGELLALEFRLRATPALVTLESVTGQVAGNQLTASGQVHQWTEAQRRVELELHLPDGQLQADTLPLLHEALGREALGLPENLRGNFSADLQFHSSPSEQSLKGIVDLRGFRYAANDIPPLEDIRGELEVAGTRVRFARVTGRIFENPAKISGEVRGDLLALRLTAEDIPFSRLPLNLAESLPVENLTGRLQLDAAISGTIERPTVSGVATLTEAGFDFRGVAVRDVAGQARFDRDLVRWQSITGRAADCRFRLSGRLVPRQWRETLAGEAVAPDCQLSQWVRLAKQAGIGTAALEADALAGTGTATAEFDSKQWRAQLEVRGASWKPGWLGLPVEDIDARLRITPSWLEVRRVSGQLGRSPVSLRGRVGLGRSAASPWELELDTQLEPRDAERLLPERWRKWVRVPAVLAGRARLGGLPEKGLELEARIQTALLTRDRGGSPAPVPASVPRELELRGVWSQPVFRVESLQVKLGTADLGGRGRVQFGPEKHVELDLQAPAGTPLPELLAFLRLPQALDSAEGSLAADVRIAGPPDNLAWSGTIDLKEVRLPALLSDPVRLAGRIGLNGEGAQLQGLEVIQPLGAFSLSGQLRAHGESALRLSGAWANLDRLLGQLRQSQLSFPRREFLAAHPLRMGVEIERAQFLEMVVENLRGELEQTGGDIALRIDHFDLGPGRGRVHVQLEPNGTQIRTRLHMEEIPTETLLVDLLKGEPVAQGPIEVDADLRGPLGSPKSFLHGTEGQIQFAIGRGRLQKGTLPERLFAMAVLLREGLYGFSLHRLGRVLKPRGLRRFRQWTGTIELQQGTARVVESALVAKIYDVDLTGEVDLESDAFQLHGEGSFHPGWELDISLKNLVNTLARLFRLARGRREHFFEFDVTGDLRGQKNLQNFSWKD